MATKPRKHTRALKLKVVHEYIGGTSVAVLVRKYQIHANLVYKWRQQFEADPVGAFRGSDDAVPVTDEGRITALESENAALAQLLGKTLLEMDFLKKALQHAERSVAAFPRKTGAE
jgi:transposase-like protein